MTLQDKISLVELFMVTISAIAVCVGTFSAFTLYKRQKEDSLTEGRQANRASVTEAWMRWHAEMLYNDNNVEIAARILRRGHNIFGGDGTVKPDQARAFHLLYMLLNALFLEYRFRKEYSEDILDFDHTVENALSGLVLHEEQAFRHLSKNLWSLFRGFPMDFQIAVDRTLDKIRETDAAKLTAKWPNA